VNAFRRPGLLAALVVLPLTLGWGAPTPSSFAPAAVLNALVQAYPGVAFTSFWATQLRIKDQVFDWSEGRLLPVGSAQDWHELAPQPFYAYPASAVDVAAWSPDELAEAEARLADRAATLVKRDPAFFDALWGIHDRATADNAQKQIRFLGMTVTVHQGIIAPLARVEARLNAARTADPSLDEFLRSLDHLEGFNWRTIAGTQSRSNHSYGTAIDVLPRAFAGKNPYWLWAPQGWPGWYRQAWNRRWIPHPSFVRAFEAEGFVWGGKWLLFDTIHFEYRPEILVLNGLR
jgi:hypothetical protein